MRTESKVYVLHVGADCNYSIEGVWEDRSEAEAATLATVQDMWNAGGYDPNEVQLPQTFEEVQKWNDYWDGEVDQQVALHEVTFFPRR